MSKLLIIGAGGHGKVVEEIAEMAGNWQDISFLDDKKPLGERIIGKIEDLSTLREQYKDLAIAIGDNARRVEIGILAIKLGFNLPVIAHPSAVISNKSSIGNGTVILPNAVINAGTRIGLLCIINTASTIDHDCVIGDGVHISPGANLGGGVTIDICSWICLGAKVINGVTLGRNSILAAGSVLLKDAGDYELLAGVPARFKKRIIGNAER